MGAPSFNGSEGAGRWVLASTGYLGIGSRGRGYVAPSSL